MARKFAAAQAVYARMGFVFLQAPSSVMMVELAMWGPPAVDAFAALQAPSAVMKTVSRSAQVHLATMNARA